MINQLIFITVEIKGRILLGRNYRAPVRMAQFSAMNLDRNTDFEVYNVKWMGVFMYGRKVVIFLSHWDLLSFFRYMSAVSLAFLPYYRKKRGATVLGMPFKKASCKSHDIFSR